MQLLFQMCLCSSLVPDTFLVGNITSILKRGKDPTSCGSYRPITVACTLSKFEYVLLPDLLSKVVYMSNQFGFKPYIGCQHAHCAPTTSLLEAHKNGFEFHFCALDVSKAFDSICHFLCLYVSIISILRFWYANSCVRLESGDNNVGNVAILSGLRLGGDLSPYLFNACLYFVLPRTNASCF